MDVDNLRTIAYSDQIDAAQADLINVLLDSCAIMQDLLDAREKLIATQRETIDHQRATIAMLRR